MSDVLESKCYGKGWDGLTDEMCKECNGQVSCKDNFINGVFWEYMNNPANAGKTVDTISTELSVSVESITECISAVEAIKGLTKSESEEPKKEIEVKEAVEKETVQEEKQEVVETPVEVTKGPVKARRGRKPADLITCPVCGGTGGTVDNLCEVCGGYGDISEKKWKAIEKKASKSEKKVVREEVVKVVNTSGEIIFESEPVVVAKPKTEKIDNPKTSVVEVQNRATGENVATWGKFPFTIFDLKELGKHGAVIATHMENGKVMSSINYEMAIEDFYKEQ